METYEKNGKSIPYIIIKKRIKKTYFRVLENHVRITTNLYTTKKQLIHYLDKIFDQLYGQLEKHQTNQLTDHEIILWGIKYNLEVSKGKFQYQQIDQTVFVQTQLTDFNKIKQQIYLHEIKDRYQTLKPQINQVISQKGLIELPFKFKFLKSKYGSYHRHHQEITLNTFLATLDEIFLIYVIYHEYAHALVFNHSKDFYNLLDEFMPNHRLYQKDLKRIAII
jgi:predicted metal-dependent hydrolase